MHYNGIIKLKGDSFLLIVIFIQDLVFGDVILWIFHYHMVNEINTS